MSLISTVSPKNNPSKIQQKEIHHGKKYITNLDHHTCDKRNDNPRTTNEKGYPHV